MFFFKAYYENQHILLNSLLAITWHQEWHHDIQDEPTLIIPDSNPLANNNDEVQASTSSAVQHNIKTFITVESDCDSEGCVTYKPFKPMKRELSNLSSYAIEKKGKTEITRSSTVDNFISEMKLVKSISELSFINDDDEDQISLSISKLTGLDSEDKIITCSKSLKRELSVDTLIDSKKTKNLKIPILEETVNDTILDFLDSNNF